MMSAIVSAPKKIVLPTPVQTFAHERGLTPYLPGIVEVAQRVFADATDITVQIHDDPDEDGLRCILFEVVLPWSVEQRRLGMKTWYRDTAAICPAALRHTFSLITYRRP
jgi:hypothetical protein